MTATCGQGAEAELARLRRQVRGLQAGFVALACAGLIAAAPLTSGVIRAGGLIIVDDQGRERVLLGAPAPPAAGRRDDVTTSLVFRSETGADRLILGESPNPRIGGRTYPRVGTSWGVTLFDPAGDERGGFSYLDNGRSVLALDRPSGDAVALTVNEATGFAGLVLNYDTGRIGDYAEGLRLGTKGASAFVQATNRDGSPAGTLVAGAGGRPRLADKAP